MLSNIEWLGQNYERFVGIVITGKGKSKTPIDSKKGGHWLYSDTNTPAARFALAKEKHAEGYGIGVLLPDDILVVDLDNKDASEADGVARWSEISTQAFTYKSTSGKGRHIWMKNPLDYPYVSSYKAVSGIDNDAAVELFAGQNKYVKLPDNNGFDWSELDLDDLPELPTDFLKGVGKSQKLAGEIKLEFTPKLEVSSFYSLFINVMAYPSMPHRSDLFPFIATLKNVAEYYRLFHKDDNFALRIEALALFRTKQDEATNRYSAKQMFDALEYRGKKGKGLHFIVNQSPDFEGHGNEDLEESFDEVWDDFRAKHPESPKVQGFSSAFKVC